MASGRDDGFTMLEVLIAIVVLSIGLLGLAGLQATGLRNNQGAALRSIAIQQAYDMADRMRGNPGSVANGLYYNTAGAADANCNTVTGCSPASMAANDVFEWNRANANLLPGGQGTITAGPAAGLSTVTVMWDERRTGATGTDCDLNDLNDLICFRITF